MAINFLTGLDVKGTVNLNKNELQNAAIQNLATAPATPASGQVYLNTVDNNLYIRIGAAWVDLTSQGDITAVATGSPDQLSIANPGGPIPTFTVTTGSVGDGLTNLVTSGTIWSYIDALPIGVESVTTGAAATITIGGTASNPTVAANTAAIADAGTNLATGDQIHTFVTGFNYTTNVGTVTSVAAGDGIRITGTASVTPTVGLQYTGATNYIKVQGTDTALSDDLISFSADATNDVKSTALKDVPMAALTAVKTYVDTAVAGASSFQGGYNAATNVPNLDATPTISILQGFQWAVTADGLFFTEQVRIGDLIIANNDSPTTLAEWTTVQGNVDLATTTVAGIASFSADNFAVSAAGAVTIKNNGVILGTETTGNYVANVTTGTGLDGAVASEGGTAALALDFSELSTSSEAAIFITLVDGESVPKRTTAANAAIALNSESTFAATITANATVTHNLGTKDVIVQLYDIVTFDTVYADVDRATTNTVGISFGATPTNSIRVLVQKIG